MKNISQFQQSPKLSTKSFLYPITSPISTSTQSSRRNSITSEFPHFAPSSLPVFYRTYSRRKPLTGARENYKQSMERVIKGLVELGGLDRKEEELVMEMGEQLKCFASGRWLWVGGTEWSKKEKNYSGGYNCTSTDIEDVEAIGEVMELAMMGCGCGANLEQSRVKQLPKVNCEVEVEVVGEFGKFLKGNRIEQTVVEVEKVVKENIEVEEVVKENIKVEKVVKENIEVEKVIKENIEVEKKERIKITVGDSREGWRDSVNALLSIAMNGNQVPKEVIIDISNIRKAGEELQGFGGTANPIRLPIMYKRISNILKKACGRQLTSLEVCLILDECALCVVAGNIRRSAGMRQFSQDDIEGAVAKENLWICDENGKWRIDQEREALRMANHTRVWHCVPEYKVIEESIRKQFFCGEGAIQFAPEAIARGNADLLDTPQKKIEFISIYTKEGIDSAGKYLQKFSGQQQMSKYELNHRLNRYSLNPCGEIIGKDFHCNLSEIHLNMIDPSDEYTLKRAFKSGAISVACLLNHKFLNARYRSSSEIDPIVGVSFTGLFDHFVQKFGAEWLEWFAKGRDKNSVEGIKFNELERETLTKWKQIVYKQLLKYCKKHNLKMPNRYTTVQPAGTKSLLTGASPGWHPPKAQRFIRRIIFDKKNPLVPTLQEWGYNIIPDSSARDENGQLLDDVEDERVKEVLVEIPTEVIWANQPGVEGIDVNQFSAKAQFDFYMNIQKYYTTHNTSATIEFRENEIPELASLIHEAILNNDGYISLALLARFDANETFPRLPFEPITKEKYQQLMEKVSKVRKERAGKKTFYEILQECDSVKVELNGAAGCDSDKCLFSLKDK